MAIYLHHQCYYIKNKLILTIVTASFVGTLFATNIETRTNNHGISLGND
jgi:hypothetical protein